jgi:cytoskeletal protein RodZ
MMFLSSHWQAKVGEFGDKFRKAREKKELSLDDVSNVTKIGSRMLQAIEEEHFDQLPGGVFNKGFIRAYAKHLGLNDEEAVTDYLACLRQAQIDAQEVWEPQRPRHPRPSSPVKPRVLEPNKPEPGKPAVNSQPPAQVEELPELQLPRAEDVRPRRNNLGGKFTHEIPWRILAITAVVVVLGVILWTRRSHSTNTAAASTAPARTMQSKTEPATTEQATTAPSAPVTVPAQAPRNQPSAVVSSTSTSSHSSTLNSQPPQPTEPASAAHPATPASASRPDADGNSSGNDVTVRSFAKPSPQPTGKSTATLTLVIRATETSWISVLADGQTVSQETLIAPAHTSVRATREIVARIGNAAGVTFLWNGQEIPAAGAEAEVKTFVFDANGMRVVPVTQSPAQNP